MEVCSNASRICFVLMTKCTLSHKSLPCVSYKQKYIYIYIYVTTMCFKENYCMIQQGSFALFLTRDMLT